MKGRQCSKYVFENVLNSSVSEDNVISSSGDHSPEGQFRICDYESACKNASVAEIGDRL